MKKRTRTQPSNPFYSNEPAVGTGLIAGKPLVQNSSLGNQPPKIVDKKPGRMSGVAGFASKGKLPSKPSHISVPKLGTAAKVPQQGKLRMSGHTSAHRIGSKLK